jgi:hypothetical protein
MVARSTRRRGYVFRMYLYRHNVTHRRANPLLLRVGSLPDVSLLLDPRRPGDEVSNQSVLYYADELDAMLALVRDRAASLATALGI